MTNQPNPNSKRTKRRNARKFFENNMKSRPQRRAAYRLASAIRGYEEACKSDARNGAKAYTKAGKISHW